MNARQRPLFFALTALVAGWLLAMAGYALADHWKMTADKLRAYLAQTDLNRLSGEARAKALRDLEAKINALSPEERRNARLGKLWAEWFAEMTDEEKSAFLDATLPSGFKQMLTSFEQLAPEKRKQAIDSAIKNLKEAREKSPEEFKKSNAGGTNAPVLSEDLQKQVAVIGLKSVYSDSSAEAKAELAPLLEEIQKNMESGRLFRGGH
jgi:FKBP-type peptidyl-prolyl cis-trans isomerase